MANISITVEDEGANKMLMKRGHAEGCGSSWEEQVQQSAYRYLGSPVQLMRAARLFNKAGKSGKQTSAIKIETDGTHAESKQSQLLPNLNQAVLKQQAETHSEEDVNIGSYVNHSKPVTDRSDDTTGCGTPSQLSRAITTNKTKSHRKDSAAIVYRDKRGYTARPLGRHHHFHQQSRFHDSDDFKFSLYNIKKLLEHYDPDQVEVRKGWAFLRRQVRSGLFWLKLRQHAAKERFRHAIKIILILLRWISSLTEKSDDNGNHEKQGRTFTDIAQEAFTSDELKNSGLTFDVSKFKARKVINISNEVKTILCTPSRTRSAEQLQTVLYGLQHLKSFAEYPLHMQEKLCKVAWFQQVPPKRVIIRQGHFAENFYFILAGQVVVRILEKNPKTGETNLRTASIMRKGTSFGELALLHHSRRTATVVSQDTVQLLTIGRDDFFDIFMSGQGPGEIPEHIQFVSGLDFMSDWPCEELLDHPEFCLFHFFKRGVVIVNDSNKSDWLYIIKSGSCQVMKELKSVVPSLGRIRTDLSDDTSLPVRLPKIGTGDAVPRVDTGIRRYSADGHPQLLTVTDMFEKERDIKNAKEEEEAKLFLKVPLKKSPRYATEDLLDNMTGKRANSLLTEPQKVDSFSKSRFRRYPKTKEPHMQAHDITSPTSSHTANYQRSQHASRHSVTSTSDNTNSKGPIFVQVEILKPKDVFGLNTINFDNDVDRTTTTVSLVSNGAECVMLSKKFFTDHANELVKKMIRHQIRPYPTESSLQENLQIKVDWNVYKKQLIRETIAYRQRLSEYVSS